MDMGDRERMISGREKKIGGKGEEDLERLIDTCKLPALASSPMPGSEREGGPVLARSIDRIGSGEGGVKYTFH